MASGVIYALTNLGQGGDFRDLSCPIVTLAVEVELFHAPRPDRSAEIARYVRTEKGVGLIQAQTEPPQGRGPRRTPEGSSGPWVAPLHAPRPTFTSLDT